jgi:hypothetical protein
LYKASTDKRKTVVRTLRLEESLARSLQVDAADEGASVNAVVNKILSQYYGWGKRAREFGFFSLHKPIFAKLIEEADEETLVRLGEEEVYNTWKEMAEFWLQDSAPDKMLEVIGLRDKLDSQTESRITRDGDTYTIVFRNDYGPKFSIVAESALRKFVRHSFHVEPRITRGGTVVTARFKTSPRNSPA